MFSSLLGAGSSSAPLISTAILLPSRRWGGRESWGWRSMARAAGAAHPRACCGRDDVCWQAAGRPQSHPSTPGGHSGLALLWCSVRRARWSFVSPDRSHDEPIYRHTERRGVKAWVARDPCVPACFGLSATLAIRREVYLSPRRSYVVVPFPPLGRHAPVSAWWGR